MCQVLLVPICNRAATYSSLTVVSHRNRCAIATFLHYSFNRGLISSVQRA